MKRTIAPLLLLSIALTTVSLYAQEAGAKPAPKVIQIFMEDVKAGHASAHEATEAGWPKAYRASKAATPYLAMTSITGRNEAWFVTGYPSLEAWENQRKAEQADPTLTAELERLSAADAEHINSVRTITARFREDLSLRPAINLGHYRYINAVTVRVRPGQVNKFVEARKIIKAAHEKAGLTDYYGVFEITSGVRAPAYMIIIYMKSLAEADAAPALHTSDAYRAAMGGELGEQKLNELVSASVIDNESMVLAFSPKMSLPSAEFIAADADFWTPKPVVAATASKAKVKAAKKE